MKLRTLLIVFIFTGVCCTSNDEDEREALMEAFETYETAWSNSDFLTVETFFTDDAKRLHTEPHVWDRMEIKHYFEERAASEKGVLKTVTKKDWKADREYIEIRIEGNIAYDIFTTERFKALHIWEKQDNGAWKIKYDVGMLNYPEEK